MLENHTLVRRIGVLLAVPVASAGLIGAAQLLAPASQPPASAELVSRNGAAAGGAAGGPAGSTSDPAPASSSTGTAPLRRSGVPGLVVRGRYVLRGPATVPEGSSVVFVLQGPTRVVRGARTAPWTAVLDTRTIPDGDYRLAVQTVRPGGKRSTVRLQHLTVANHHLPGRPTPTPPTSTSGSSSSAPADPTGSSTGATGPSGSSPASSSGTGPSSSSSSAVTTTSTTTATTTSTTRPTSTSTSTSTSTANSSSSGSYADQVVSLTNKERLNAGCPALVANDTLTKVAQAHSEDMAAHNYFNHNSQDGRSPFDRMTAAGYQYSSAAENIAAGQRTPQDVVTAWMNSAGHRANILNCSLRQIGVGYATGGQYGSYWTQDFGTPR